jgi:hypothetical protein
MDKFGLFFRWRRRDEEIIKTIKERKKERLSLSLSLYLKKKKKSILLSPPSTTTSSSSSFSSPMGVSIYPSINLTIFFRFLS